jgi:hypothetical protein
LKFEKLEGSKPDDVDITRRKGPFSGYKLWNSETRMCNSKLLKVAQSYSKLLKVAQSCSKLLKVAQTCSNLLKLAQTCSNLLKVAPTCSNLLNTSKFITRICSKLLNRQIARTQAGLRARVTRARGPGLPDLPVVLNLLYGRSQHATSFSRRSWSDVIYSGRILYILYTHTAIKSIFYGSGAKNFKWRKSDVS